MHILAIFYVIIMALLNTAAGACLVLCSDSSEKWLGPAIGSFQVLSSLSITFAAIQMGWLSIP